MDKETILGGAILITLALFVGGLCWYANNPSEATIWIEIVKPLMVAGMCVLGGISFVVGIVMILHGLVENK